MYRFISFLILTTLAFSACTPTETVIVKYEDDKPSQENTGTLQPDQSESPEASKTITRADLRFGEYWTAGYRSIVFSEDGTFSAPINAETDCHFGGTYTLKGDLVKLNYTSCGANPIGTIDPEYHPKTVTLSLGSNSKHFLYSEYLESNETKDRFYNQDSRHEDGHIISYEVDGVTYDISVPSNQPEFKDDMVLHFSPSLSSDYMTIDGGNDKTYQYLGTDEVLRKYIGSTEIDGETWHLVNEFTYVYGTSHVYNANGELLREGWEEVPYTWIHSSDIDA